MTTSIRYPEATDISQAIPLMAEQIQAALLDMSGIESLQKDHHTRLTVKIPYIDPLIWLQAQISSERIYWSDRDTGFEMAGVGIADQTEIDPKLSEQLFSSDSWSDDKCKSGSTRYFGGHRFSPVAHVSDRTWDSFPGGRFVLPRFELYMENDQTWFVCNLIPNRDRDEKDNLLDQLSQVLFADAERLSDVPNLLKRIDMPNHEGWTSGVQAVLQSIANGYLSKVVLARRSTLQFDRVLDPVSLLRHLKFRSSGCYHFLFQFDSSSAFVGASPERLFRRTGSRLESEAVAGTRPRGETVDEDVRMEQELVGSKKDITEHQFVVDDISRVIENLCSDWKIITNGDNDSLMKLARVQHLITRLEGQLENGHSDLSIVSMLHPTSAVGGVPQSKALEMINDLEPFDRGWYAAPVGWIGADSAEFAVAIRSGLVKDSTLQLYSGAGIVDGSSAENEWREIDSKLANSLAALE